VPGEYVDGMSNNNNSALMDCKSNLVDGTLITDQLELTCVYNSAKPDRATSNMATINSQHQDLDFLTFLIGGNINPGCATVNAIEAIATIAPSSARNTGSSLILGLPQPPAISGRR
jgi:hypothetical protein